MDLDFQEYLDEQLRDPEFAKRYRELEPARHIAQQVIMLRQKEGITQAELAKRVGTQQSAISRLENASSVPSLSFVQRVAEALGADIHVILEPQAT
jgi:DNA-binding XRE family transcriptional regulator